MPPKRFRLKFMFWLDLSKSDEYELAEHIDSLKTQRLFSQTVRDGIRLISELRAGRTDTLYTMFPWLVAETSPPHNTLDQAIRQEIDQLRGLITAQQAATPLPSGGFSPPDEPVQLQVKTATGGSSAKNFLSSLLSLQPEKG